MRELSLDRLRTLVTVAELGSFIAAAKLLHLAPPTVTLHVNELGKRMALQMLLRKRQHIQPTDVGQAFIARAQRLLNQNDAMLQDVQLHTEGKTGRVRISASTPVIAYLLPTPLQRLADKHPGIEIELTVLNSAKAMQR